MYVTDFVRVCVCVCVLQEVVLHRSSSDEKLGLTLCYGSLEDEITDIFISEVSPLFVCFVSLCLRHLFLPFSFVSLFEASLLHADITLMVDWA